VSVEKEGFELISIGGETLGVGSNERIREVVRRLRDGFWVWTSEGQGMGFKVYLTVWLQVLFK